MGIFSRFPSFTQLYQNAGATFLRFPLTLISAIVATVAAIMWAESGSFADDFAGRRLLITAALGVPLFTALTTFADRQQWSSALKRAFPALGIVALALFYLTLPMDIDDPNSILMRWFLLAIGLHFLVAFLPFLGKDQQVGFWQYNKTLFLRFLLAALYSGVVYIGLAIALLAGDKLFGINIDDDIYLDLWLIATGVFNTWVFLSWIPTDLDALNESDSYPGGLKVFTQFILLPLVVLYFIILIAYEAKILVTWNWPRGWVSNLVLWYSVVGILSLLLLHPLQKLTENRWIAAFGRWYFRGSIPLVVLLFFAILERVGEYGVTVNRYLVIGMAIGLALVVAYFVFSRAKDIRLIPIILFSLVFLSTYGPWSAFSVAESSQRGRLVGYMSQHGILVDGTIQRAPETIPIEDRKEMSSIIRYLEDWHGTDAFKPWIDDSTLLVWDTSSIYKPIPDSIAARMGFDLIAHWESAQLDGRFHFGADESKTAPLDVSDYDYIYDINYYVPTDSVITFNFDTASCFIRLYPGTAQMSICVGTNANDSSSIARLDLVPHLQSLQENGQQYSIHPETLSFGAESEGIVFSLRISNVNGKNEGDSFEIESLRARILVGRK